MQWLARVCVERPVFALMLIAAVVVAGAAAYPQLGIDRFPNIDLPTIRVATNYPGAAAAEVESEVSQPLEDAVATVAGIDELRSLSNDGVSMLMITFRLDVNIGVASQDVRDAVNSVLNRLPPGIDPPVVQKQDLDASPIMTLAVFGQREPRELYVLADRSVKSIIESARGVGQVLIEGASDRAVQINLEADRLAAHRTSVMQVYDAISSQNAEIPAGRVDAGFRELSLRTLGRLPKTSEFNNLVVSTVGDVPLRISDLGEAVDLTKERRSLALFDGQPAVVLQVQRQSGENTVEVIDAVKERLKQVRELLPPDVRVEVLQDQSRYIRAALHEIQHHLVIGSLMASVIVLLFMRSWRSTIIAAVAIPTSIIGAFAVMKGMDFTLNNVTMLALVLMVGVVIDDAIIVLENVFRVIEEQRLEPKRAAIFGTQEIGLAVLATTISLVIVFLPVSFLSSVTGRLLYEFGITSTVAVMISMLVSFSLTPMMCSRMLKAPKQEGVGSLLRLETAPSPDAPQSQKAPDPVRHDSHDVASRRGFYRYIENSYMWCLRLSMRHRWFILLVSVVVIASNVPLFNLVQQDYIPTDVDEGEFEVRISAPEGTSITAMDQMIAAVEPKVREVPGVVHVLSTVSGSSPRGTSQASMYVRLDDLETRTFSLGRLWHGLLEGNPNQAFEGNYNQRDKMREVRSIIAAYPDLRASVRNLTSFRQGAPVDLDFVVTGPDLQELADFTDRLRDRVAEMPGLVDADSTLRMDKPNLLAHIDRERAAALGVDVREIADTLRIAVGGDDRVSRFYDSQADDAYDVELRLRGVDRADPRDISQLYVRTANPRAAGNANRTIPAAEPTLIPGLGYETGDQPLTRLDNVVSFEETFSPSRIDRLDRLRMAAVRANLAPGYALAEQARLVQKAAEDLGLPPGYSTRVVGGARELQTTLEEFIWTCALSFVCMYIVLAAQYEHLIHPLTILASLPIAIPFGLFSLWLGGESLNLYSALGILVLFGMVKKASILQVDHINQLRAAGLPRNEAILEGNRNRLRPILMTAIAFVAGMVPLLIATGPGAEERRSIAVLVVGGQALSLLLTLLAVPVIYSLLDDLSALFVRRAAAPSTTPPPTTTPPATTTLSGQVATA
ncbi:efflux RND transporter permease subunit [Lacipirellula sp.]|uniref:efflux RND transporter permease subunit n=1 Tax=Lacipirellula sp. TaxID=2691419 RepID=UPI003D0EBD7C